MEKSLQNKITERNYSIPDRYMNKSNMIYNINKSFTYTASKIEMKLIEIT